MFSRIDKVCFQPHASGGAKPHEDNSIISVATSCYHKRPVLYRAARRFCKESSLFDSEKYSSAQTRLPLFVYPFCAGLLP